MNESLILSEDNYYYKYDKWENGESNKLFIVGLSGSGKTVLGKRLAKEYKCDYISLDQLRKKLKNEFIEKFSLDKNKTINWDTVEKIKTIHSITIDYIKRIKKRCVIEGVQLLYLDFNYISKYPIIVINTSLLLSSFRAYVRNRQVSDKSDRINTIRDIIRIQNDFVKGLYIFKKKLKMLDQ